MHSWRRNVELLEQVAMPQTVGFQADMAHTMLFTMGFNAPEDKLLPDDFEWSQTERLAARLSTDGPRTAPVDFRLPRRAK